MALRAAVSDRAVGGRTKNATDGAICPAAGKEGISRQSKQRWDRRKHALGNRTRRAKINEAGRASRGQREGWLWHQESDPGRGGKERLQGLEGQDRGNRLSEEGVCLPARERPDARSGRSPRGHRDGHGPCTGWAEQRAVVPAGDEREQEPSDANRQATGLN